MCNVVIYQFINKFGLTIIVAITKYAIRLTVGNKLFNYMILDKEKRIRNKYEVKTSLVSHIYRN